MLTINSEQDIIYIHTDQIEKENWASWFYFLTVYDKYFADYDTYKKFFLEIGKNHPEGVNITWLGHFVSQYTRTLYYGPLIERGVLEELYTDDGTVFYRLNLNTPKE